MSEMPARVNEAGLLLQRPSILSDPEALKRVIAWGHEQIDIAYPEDPIRAPLNLIKRALAHREWDDVVRNAGRDLRGTIMSAAVQELEFEITRRQENIRAQDAERLRREAAKHDSQLRVDEHERISATDLDRDLARLERAHELLQQAEDAASRRRIDEQYATIISHAVGNALAGSSAEQILETTRMVNDEVTRIRRNPDLTPNDQHFQIKTLLETLPYMARGIRAHDV